MYIELLCSESRRLSSYGRVAILDGDIVLCSVIDVYSHRSVSFCPKNDWCRKAEAGYCNPFVSNQICELLFELLLFTLRMAVRGCV